MQKNDIGGPESCSSSDQGSRDPNESVQNHRKRKSRTISDQPQKIKKISDWLGPSGLQTEQSVDLCLDSPFADGPVEARFDPKLLKLHWSLKSHDLSLESVWVIQYESYDLHLQCKFYIFNDYSYIGKLYQVKNFRMVHPSISLVWLTTATNPRI